MSSRSEKNKDNEDGYSRLTTNKNKRKHESLNRSSNTDKKIAATMHVYHTAARLKDVSVEVDTIMDTLKDPKPTALSKKAKVAIWKNSLKPFIDSAARSLFNDAKLLAPVSRTKFQPFLNSFPLQVMRMEHTPSAKQSM